MTLKEDTNMAHCSNCGHKIDENAAFCPSCGAPVAQQAEQPAQQAPPPPPEQPQYQQYQQAPPPPPHGQVPAFMNTPDSTGQYHPQDIQNNKVMAVLAYIGILVLVPLFAAKESPFARFHTNQGLVLLIVDVIGIVLNYVLGAIFFAISWKLLFLTTIISLVIWLGLLAFSVIGIVNAASGKAKQLPLIGKITLLK
jgi:uncharacterized membrane protein